MPISTEPDAWRHLWVETLFRVPVPALFGACSMVRLLNTEGLGQRPRERACRLHGRAAIHCSTNKLSISGASKTRMQQQRVRLAESASFQLDTLLSLK
eukprot:1117640-Pelagomonas_calceolata.AAC.7